MAGGAHGCLTPDSVANRASTRGAGDWGEPVCPRDTLAFAEATYHLLEK